MKFKVGDLVKVNEIAGPEHWRGKAGMLIHVKRAEAGPQRMLDYDYEVLVGDEGKICFYENELELMNKGTGNE